MDRAKAAGEVLRRYAPMLASKVGGGGVGRGGGGGGRGGRGGPSFAQPPEGPVRNDQAVEAMLGKMAWPMSAYMQSCPKSRQSG